MFRRYTLLAAGALMFGWLPTLAAQQTNPPPAHAAQQQQKPAAKPAAARTWTMAQIKDVQTELAGLKLYSGPATGRMDIETRRAIRTFQKSHNIPVTGRLSDTLLVLLKAPAPAK